MKFYQLLKERNLKQVIQYFDDNWHGIKQRWVEGLKCEACHYLNSTNNRLESINQKIKSVVTKYSSLVNFFQELMKCLDSLALERDHCAAMVFKKCSVNLYPENNCLSEYQQLLTPYAFSFLIKQFKLCSQVKITEGVRVDKNSYTTTIHSKGRSFLTSDCHCNCGFHTAMELPCKHIFALRKHANLNVFQAKLCAIRWTHDYYRNSHRVFSTNATLSTSVSVSTMDRLPALKVLSQNEKYRKVFAIAQKLANVASYISTREFSYAVQCLEKLLKAWEQGQHVTVEVVDVINCHGQDTNEYVGDDPGHHDVDLTDDNPPDNFTSDNCFDTEESQPNLNTEESPLDLNTEESPPNLNPKESPLDLNTEESPFDLNPKESLLDLNTEESPPPKESLLDHNTEESPPDLNPKELPPDLTTEASPPDLDTEESPPNLNLKESPLDLNTEESLPDLTAKKSLPDLNTEESLYDDHHAVTSNFPAKTLDLTSIKLPPKIRKRGRPKGAGLTVIGLPRKRKYTDGPVKFLRKSNSEREKQILSWMLPDHLVEKVLQNEILECEQLDGNLLEFSPNILDENVNWASVQKYFTRAAWIQVTDKMAKLKKHPKWKCGTCHEDLLSSPSVVCESCLIWFHLKCVGLTAAPKKTL